MYQTWENTSFIPNDCEAFYARQEELALDADGVEPDRRGFVLRAFGSELSFRALHRLAIALWADSGDASWTGIYEAHASATIPVDHVEVRRCIHVMEAYGFPRPPRRRSSAWPSIRRPAGILVGYTPSSEVPVGRSLRWDVAFGFAFVVACSPAPREAGLVADAEVAAVVGANNRLALDLLAQNRDPNLIVSPFSVFAALSMTQVGARGQTAAEIAQVLHLDPGSQGHHQALGALLQDLNGDQGRDYTLRVANRVWAQRGYAWSSDFRQTLARDYASPLAEADFRRSPERALRNLNAWVEDQTDGMVPLLLAELPPEASLVLANAIVFDGLWTDPFLRSDTQPAPFYTPGGIQQVPTMSGPRQAPLAIGDGYRAMGLPYGSEQEVRMWIVLPDAIDGLSQVEASLTAESFTEAVDAATYAHLSVTLPRLQLRTRLDLRPVLENLGLTRAWSPGADFSGTGVSDQYLSEVRHEATLEMDELGSRAAAATVGIIERVAPEPERTAFEVDRPYLLVLRDEVTGTILFVGRVSDPSPPG
jgi:serpin B